MLWNFHLSYEAQDAQMERTLEKIKQGYKLFREKYALGDDAIMHQLSSHGQNPHFMVVACCDSRVDPALILQCEPGDVFVVRNVANIVPPFEKDEAHHGTSAALEFGIQFLNIKHLILLGHSQCGGIQALLKGKKMHKNDFISNWVALAKSHHNHHKDVDAFSQKALLDSYENCLTFPWIKEKLQKKELKIHLWFFDIKEGAIYSYSKEREKYLPLEESFFN